MTDHENHTIAGKLDRVTGKPATIYTPPEDLVDPSRASRANVPADSGARVAAYAEAIRSHRAEVFLESRPDGFGWHCLTCQEERVPFTHSVEVAEQDALAHGTRAVMAVADAELADLTRDLEEARAEVERLRAERDQYAVAHPMAVARAESAEARAVEALARESRLREAVEQHKAALNVALDLAARAGYLTPADMEALDGARMVLDDAPGTALAESGREDTPNPEGEAGE